METAWDALAAEDEGNLYLDSDLAEKIYVAYHVLDADPIKGAPRSFRGRRDSEKRQQERPEALAKAAKSRSEPG